MARFQRHFSLALICAFLLVVAISCSTSPREATDDLEVDQLLPEHLVQTPDVLMAMRFQPDAVPTLAGPLGRLATAFNEPELETIARLSDDPIARLTEEYGMPNELPSLDGQSSSFLLLTHRGNTDFLQAAMLGLPTKVEEWPNYLHFRLLLPSDDPQALQQELVPWLDTMVAEEVISAHRVFVEERFVRVELATPFSPRTDPDEVDPGRWLDDLRLDQVQPPATADYRRTPAYEAFVDEAAPAAMWAPLESFATLSTFELVDQFARDYQRVGPAAEPRYFLQGVSRIAAGALVDDPIAAENEDVSLVVTAHEVSGVVADLHATRTERGVQLYRALQGDIALPPISTADSFLELAFQIDYDVLQRQAEYPLWATLDAAAGFGGQFDAMGQATLPFAEDDTAFGLAGVALQYPWANFRYSSETLGQLVPLPRALRLEGLIVDDPELVPVGAILVGAFPDVPQTRAAIEQLFDLAESRVPGLLDAELLERDDDLLEVRIVANISLLQAFGESPPARPVEELSLSVDLNALDALDDMVDGTETVSHFDTLHIRSLGADGHQTFRIGIGTPIAVNPQPLDTQIEPLQTPTSRCRTELAAAAIEHLSDLRSDPHGRIDRWEAAVRERASDCIDPNHPAFPLIDERVERAREIAAEIP